MLSILLIAAAWPPSAVAGHEDPRLDRLFDQLHQARTEGEITALMMQITGIWALSGSEAIDLLVARADEATEKGAPDIAMEIFEHVVVLAPEYAEGWRRRGALHAADGNDEEALSDLREALKLEPRHFGALDQIARILEAQDERAAALEAYRRLAELIPQAEGVRQRMQRLQPGPVGPNPDRMPDPI